MLATARELAVGTGLVGPVVRHPGVLILGLEPSLYSRLRPVELLATGFKIFRVLLEPVPDGPFRQIVLRRVADFASDDHAGQDTTGLRKLERHLLVRHHVELLLLLLVFGFGAQLCLIHSAALQRSGLTLKRRPLEMAAVMRSATGAGTAIGRCDRVHEELLLMLEVEHVPAQIVVHPAFAT